MGKRPSVYDIIEALTEANTNCHELEVDQVKHDENMPVALTSVNTLFLR